MATRGFKFHIEIIRRNKSYKDHYKLVLLLRKKNLKHSDFWRLSKTVTKFYGIKGIRNQKFADLNRTLKRQLLSAWGLHRLSDFPKPFEFGDNRFSDTPKRYKAISIHKKAKLGEKNFNSILKQLEEEYASGTRMFICVRSGCTKEDIDSIRWDNHTNRAYGKNVLRKSDPDRDLWIWDFITSKLKNKKKVPSELYLYLQAELKKKQTNLTLNALTQAYRRTTKTIASYPLSLT